MASTETHTSSKKGRFYHELITVKVEEVVHRVPKYYLETWSTMFKDMFELPQGPEAEGQSEDNPIVLSGCTNTEFESLMDVLMTPGSIVPLNLTKEQWISVLKLSTIWEIPKARVLAVSNIRTLDIPPTEMVNLGRTYKVTSLFVEGCVALAKKQYAPEELNDLATALGWDFAARVMWTSSSRSLSSMSVVGLPQNLVKCLQCSATLRLQETSGPLSSPGLTGPPPQQQPPPQMQPPNLHTVAPLSHASTMGLQSTLHMPASQASQFMMLQQQQAQQQLMAQRQAQMALGKRLLTIRYTCPTPGCQGPTGTSNLRLDMSELSRFSNSSIHGDLTDTIQTIFEDEMKDMY